MTMTVCRKAITDISLAAYILNAEGALPVRRGEAPLCPKRRRILHLIHFLYNHCP